MHLLSSRKSRPLTTRYASVGFVVVLITAFALGTAEAQRELPFYVNALANDGFEANGAAQDSLGVIAPPEWLVGGNATQASYGAGGLFPTAEYQGGSHFLAGGPQSSFSAVMQQFVVTSWESKHDIDIGWVLFEFGALLGGALTEADQSMAEVQFADSTGVLLRSASLGPVTAADRDNRTTLLPRGTAGTVPIGTRRVSCVVMMTRINGTYNNAYCDALYLRVIVPDGLSRRTWSEIKGLYGR